MIITMNQKSWFWCTNVVCAECHRPASEPPPPPVDIQSSFDLVAWRNAPNISYDDIIGYEIQFINSATNEKVTELLDASATFYNLDNLTKTFKSDLTYVQVGDKGVTSYSILLINIQVRVVSSEQHRQFSLLGTVCFASSVILQLLL